jgi:hypothetical protein
MKAGRWFVAGSFLIVLVLGLAWAGRDRVIECDRSSCVVQNRWTGVIRRVTVRDPQAERENTTAAAVDDSVVRLPGTVVEGYWEIDGFIRRCREAGVPRSTCERMAFEAGVVQRERERDAEGQTGSSNRSFVRRSCIENQVNPDVCGRWMPE